MRFSCSAAVTMASIISIFLWIGVADAVRLTTPSDWEVYIDNSLQYNFGMRAQEMNDKIGNHLFMQQGDYKFPNSGDIVTNRIEDIIEFQAVHNGNIGGRVSGTFFNDFAYDDNAKVNPKNPAFEKFNVYPSGKYSGYTKQHFVQGEELLDAFVFLNTKIADKSTYLKAGRLTQYWGNAFFFPFSNIAYSQHPIDYIKAFSQPGSEVKELFMPRAQVLATTELTRELSVSGQYFFEYRNNRYPEGGTYLGFFDILFDGPQGPGAAAAYGLTGNEGYVKPDDVHNNFGLKAAWSPDWAHGDLGFYLRQFDEVHPWYGMTNPANGYITDPFAQDVRLIGLSYERAFGSISTGFELNTRFGSALTPLGLAPTVNMEGPKGTLTNFIANAFVQLGTTPLWDSGNLLMEVSYTYLNDVTDHEELYNDAGLPGNSWEKGGATRNAVAFAALFTPQWQQVFPGVDIELPLSLTAGLYGNPAYAAGAFYAQESLIYSGGIRAIYKSKYSALLQFNGYHWKPGEVGDNGLNAGLEAYEGFGGNGPVSLNDRGWVQLLLKMSF